MPRFRKYSDLATVTQPNKIQFNPCPDFIRQRDHQIRWIDCVLFIDYVSNIYYFQPGAAQLQTVSAARLASTSAQPIKS
jgi:hypothetical protein